MRITSFNDEVYEFWSTNVSIRTVIFKLQTVSCSYISSNHSLSKFVSYIIYPFIIGLQTFTPCSAITDFVSGWPMSYCRSPWIDIVVRITERHNNRSDWYTSECVVLLKSIWRCSRFEPGSTLARLRRFCLLWNEAQPTLANQLLDYNTSIILLSVA